MPKQVLPTEAEYERLIDAFNEARGPERDEIKARIERTFSVEVTMLDLDMSGFTRITAKHGVIHFLAMIRRMRLMANAIIDRHDGQILKFEADNLFATFPTVDNALQFALDMQTGLLGMNLTTDDDSDIHVAIGIASGEVLIIENRDAWGRAMNLASRLGEDVAKPGEILVCAESFARSAMPEDYETEARILDNRGIATPILAVTKRDY